MQPEHLTFIYAFNEDSNSSKHLEELPDDKWMKQGRSLK